MIKSGSFESQKPYLLVHNLKKQHSTTFNISQDILKSANLLHKRDLDDSQLHTTVPKLFAASMTSFNAMMFEKCRKI